MKTLGVAYHSPLDVVTLVPSTFRITLDSADPADVLFTKEFAEVCDAPVQVVFASARILAKNNISIVDQGHHGQILNINKINWSSVLEG